MYATTTSELSNTHCIVNVETHQPENQLGAKHELISNFNQRTVLELRAKRGRIILSVCCKQEEGISSVSSSPVIPLTVSQGKWQKPKQKD